MARMALYGRLQIGCHTAVVAADLQSAPPDGGQIVGSWLFPWKKKRYEKGSAIGVVLYTRSGCHLCEQAWEQLEAAQRRYGFQLTATDVDSDPELATRFGTQVPVVAINGKVRFHGQVNPVLLRRLLDNA
jgi:glutaredoxin